jgi:catalase
MMQGFGVHTVPHGECDGESRFVKFHWQPRLGTHSLDWDEAVKISGPIPTSIAAICGRRSRPGAFPEYELGVQVFTEEDAAGVELRRARRDQDRARGARARCVRWAAWCSTATPDNFFTETEQVAFCTAHIVPGIDFTNDPLLAGRIHSYVTRRSRVSAVPTSTRSRSTRRWRRSTTTSGTDSTDKPSTAAA